MLLGAHVSIAGGYVNAINEAARLGIDTIQIFTKNQRFWKEKEVNPTDAKLFKAEAKKQGLKKMFSHSIYLISLGSENQEIIEKSILALAMELRRCHALGLSHTVMHPGAAGTRSTEEGIERIAKHILIALELTKDLKVKIALENTAGGGTSVGGKIENIARLVNTLNSKRIGICIDTCHAFAAGYDIRTKKGVTRFFGQIDKQIGLEKLLNLHVNDSKGALGSRIDRHAHIGEGLIGLEPFKYIMNNFSAVPKVLETPNENAADERNLNLLRNMAR
jgi:deoxyribonuclease-4